MLSNTIMIPATKTIGFHLVPGATLLIGGVLVWNIWQQRQQVKYNKFIQTKLSQQIDNLAVQLSTKKESEEIVQMKKTKTKFSSDPKYALFEQLIDDNLALREAH